MTDKLKLTEEELTAILHESHAALLDDMIEEFRGKAYRGSDIRLWLGALANKHRKAALEFYGATKA